MIFSRCITCQMEYPQNAPSFCRCGGSTFTTIHVDDEPEAPTTAPEGHKLEPAAAASTSGQSPPPPVSGSSPSSASAPKPGADFELGDEPKHDVGGVRCLQDGCGKPATHSFFWPSADEPSTRYACEEHAQKAEALAPALGFRADVKPLT